MPRQICTTVYKFDELSEKAKENALDKIRYSRSYLDWEWYDSVYEDFRQVAAILGVEVDEIYFTGFASQGDGACFEGRYEYKEGSVEEIRKYAPIDEELHRITDELQALQEQHGNRIVARVTHRDRYYHAYSTDILVEKTDWGNDEDLGFSWLPVEAEVKELLRDLMKWLYRELEREHDFQMSDEMVADHATANELEFTEEGEPI